MPIPVSTPKEVIIARAMLDMSYGQSIMVVEKINVQKVRGTVKKLVVFNMFPAIL